MAQLSIGNGTLNQQNGLLPDDLLEIDCKFAQRLILVFGNLLFHQLEIHRPFDFGKVTVEG
jgi:hypothetical protein